MSKSLIIKFLKIYLQEKDLTKYSECYIWKTPNSPNEDVRTRIQRVSNFLEYINTKF